MSDNGQKLYDAARVGDVAKLKALLSQRNTDINYRALSGRTALHLAAQKGHKDVLLLLLARGANASVKDLNGLTAAECAEDADSRAAFAMYDPPVWKGQLLGVKPAKMKKSKA